MVHLNVLEDMISFVSLYDVFNRQGCVRFVIFLALWGPAEFW